MNLKKSLKVAVLVLVLGALLGTVSELTEPPRTIGYAHPGDVFSAGASVTPAIDGTISAGGWDDAHMEAFTTPGEVEGVLYIKNDFTNLYIAVRIEDPTLSHNDTVRVMFDDDHNGRLEAGEDIIGWGSGSSPGLWDGYFDGRYVTQDAADRGTSDGETAARNHGIYNHFEISHPLDSGDDVHDFSLSIGDTVGFAIGVTIDGTPRGMWPSLNPDSWADIVIASPRGPGEGTGRSPDLDGQRLRGRCCLSPGPSGRPSLTP